MQTTTPATRTSFDPMVFGLSPGWLPDNLTDSVQRSTATMQSVSYAHFVPLDGDVSVADGQIAIPVFAPGITPYPTALLGNDGPPDGPAGPTINGSAVGMVQRHARRLPRLAWHWAPQAWAVVVGTGSLLGTADQLRATLAHVATDLRTDRNQAVTMPYSVATPPAPLALVETLINRFSGHYDAQLIFSAQSGWTEPMLPGLLVSVVEDPSVTGDAKNGRPNTTVDGHPAQVVFDGERGRVDLFGVSGHRISVLVYDALTATIVNQDATIELAKGVRLVTRPADASNWTRSPCAAPARSLYAERGVCDRAVRMSRSELACLV